MSTGALPEACSTAIRQGLTIQQQVQGLSSNAGQEDSKGQRSMPPGPIISCCYIQRSFSFSKDEPSPARKYRVPGTPKERKTVCRRRSSRRLKRPHLAANWVELMGGDVAERFSKDEIKRQEVSLLTDVCVFILALIKGIYSLFRTESELVEDLKMVVNVSVISTQCVAITTELCRYSTIHC